MSETMESPNWHKVRPIYKKLSDEFHLLSDVFGVSISQERKEKLDHLIVVIDEVDQCIDDLPKKAQRDDITNSLVAFLENNEDHWNHPNASTSLSTKMQNIKVIVHQQKIVADFVGAAKAIFYNTEAKRHTHNQDELLQLIRNEGAATAILPLSILGIAINHPFAVFFTKLCTLMGIADLVFDAKEDYKNHYIVLRPNLSLYLALNWMLVKDGAKILWQYPRPFQFVSYCLSFTWALMKGD